MLLHKVLKRHEANPSSVRFQLQRPRAEIIRRDSENVRGGKRVKVLVGRPAEVAFRLKLVQRVNKEFARISVSEGS